MEENIKKKELTYDELKDICRQLSEQNRILMEQARGIDREEWHRWMNYLFRVVETPKSFDAGFVTSCANQIVANLTPEVPEDNKEA